MLFLDCCGDYADILQRSVGSSGGHILYFLNCVHTGNHLSEYGVLTVEMRSASHRGIIIYNVIRKRLCLDGVLGLGYETLPERLKTVTVTGGLESGDLLSVALHKRTEILLTLPHNCIFRHLCHPGCGNLLPGNYVELRATAATFGIHLVACTRRGQSPALVVMAGICNLGLDGITRIAGAEHSRGVGRARRGIARLDHEVLYHTMEKYAVVESFPDKFQKIVAVFRSVVIQADFDIAERGADVHHRPRRDAVG